MQARESSPVRDRHSSTELHHSQLGVQLKTAHKLHDDTGHIQYTYHTSTVDLHRNTQPQMINRCISSTHVRLEEVFSRFCSASLLIKAIWLVSVWQPAIWIAHFEKVISTTAKWYTLQRFLQYGTKTGSLSFFNDNFGKCKPIWITLSLNNQKWSTEKSFIQSHLNCVSALPR